MRMQGNTILITGGSSGIGRGLAEAFHARGNRVIISGRREDRLKEVCGRNAGMEYVVLDVTDGRAVNAAALLLTRKFPELNCVFNNAGVQMQAGIDPEKFDEAAVMAEISTNVIAPLRVTAAFLPHLKTRPEATVVNVSSGLAFVPMTRFALYCATKAAVHSWTMSLRRQLRGTSVKVVEVIPPWVDTELGGENKPKAIGDRRPMALNAFIAETMEALATDGEELAIGDAKARWAATAPGEVKKWFKMMNP